MQEPREVADASYSLPPGCIKKVVMEERMVWDNEMRCHHVMQKNCHKTYETVYKQEQVCARTPGVASMPCSSAALVLLIVSMHY